MILQIVNLTGSTKTYLSGSISVPANSTSAVANNTSQYLLIGDSQLHSDIATNFVQISDGVTIYSGNDALRYLDTINMRLGPTSDGYGNQISSITSAGVNNLLIGLGATNYALSTANSTTAQLVASATFTGGIETVFNQQSYSILLTSDQNGTLTINQYIDAVGTFPVATMAFTITAGTPFCRSGVVNGNYFNLTFKNNGASTTTTLNINTAYGTIPSATQLNNSPTALNEINGTTPVTAGVNGLLAVGGNAASLATDSGNPLKIGSVYNSAGVTATNGQRVDLQSNQFGEIAVTHRNKFRNLTGNATTTVKSGSGTLAGVMINNNATNGTVVIYDNTAASGTKIATFNIGSPSGGLLSTSGQPGPVFLGLLGIEFSTGITVVTSGSSSNDVTILYR